MSSSIFTNCRPCFSLKTALIIEDEAIIAMDLSRILYSFGATEVKVASTAEEGLAWLRQKKPDLILMDIKLRGSISGIEAARLIQKKGPFNLVYITAYGDEAVLSEAKKIPNAGIIMKPFTLNEILRLLSSLNPQI